MSSDAALVDAWERAQGHEPWRQPLVALAALERSSADELAGAPLGVVATMSLAHGRRLFGETVDAVARCESCDEPMEVSLPLDELLAVGRAPRPAHAEVEVGGSAVSVRPLSPADAAAAASHTTRADAEAELLGRCVGPNGADRPLVPAEVEAIGQALEELDPLGLTELTLDCPTCGGTMRAALDLVAWWWDRVGAEVRLLVDDVDRLARAYGWTEHEVLALGRYRRSLYLELVS